MYFEVTGASGNEKVQVILEHFNQTLLVINRGYVSDELEEIIDHTNGNQFLI